MVWAGNVGGWMPGYQAPGTSTTWAGFPGGSDSDIAWRQRAMGPVAQYQAALAQINPEAGRYAQQAAMRGFNPAYAMYEAFGVPGTAQEQYGSFSDYLASSAGQLGQTQSDIQNRMRLIAGGTEGNMANAGMLGSALSEIYYGGDVEEAAARRLATAEALGGFGGGAANPQMQAAMQSVIDRMYGNYLGSTAYSAEDPSGFIGYYLGQRGLNSGVNA